MINIFLIDLTQSWIIKKGCRPTSKQKIIFAKISAVMFLVAHIY